MSQSPVQHYPRKAIEDALIDWLSTHTGVGADRCWWTDQGITRPSFPFGVLAWVSTRLIGQAAQGAEDLGTTGTDPDIRLWAGQPAAVLVSAQVFVDPRIDSAEARLSAAVALLGTRGVRSSFTTAGLALLSIGGVRNVGPGQAQVDLFCEIASNVSEDVHSIEHITVTPTIEGVEQPAFTVPDDVPAPPPTTVTVYYGAASVVVDTEAEVLALSSSIVVGDFPISLTINVGAGARAVFAIPVSAAIDTFTVNGFIGGFIAGATVVVDGVPVIVWSSAYQSLGVITTELSR